MNPVQTVQGTSPIVLGLPHAGTHVPQDIHAALNAHGRALADTDWHVEKLYDGLMPEATTVRANFHRYVIDANRDPEGGSLYPGQNTTGLAPMTDFDGNGIWTTPPAPLDIKQRIAAFHTPYHAALAAEMVRVHALHGVAILFDCHSIRSRIPFLFEGTLPDFNIGTNGGASCAMEIESAAAGICSQAKGFTSIVNGRFKGGWTTRHYGRPALGWHAIQMELAQSAYLTAEAAPWTYYRAKAEKLRVHLASMLNSLAALAISLGDRP
jgi:N-formylglutamate deformylase